MNKLWIWLSLFFCGLFTFTAILIFTLMFAWSWLGVEPPTMDHFHHDYVDFVTPFVETQMIAGKSEAEIIALVIQTQNLYLEESIESTREQGYAPGVDATDRTIGRILFDYINELFSPDMFGIILLGSLLGMGASLLVSRQLTRPLERLTEGSQALARRNLQHRVAVQGSREVQELATNFNTMASELQRAEELRQNMLADVSHELRTPLAGLEGMLRATLDGVLELNEEQLGSLYQQTHHLTLLVDELHLLARAEARQLPLDKTSLVITELIQDLVSMFGYMAEEKGVTLTVELEQDIVTVSADARRIRQALSNLLTNALRHTPNGGTIGIDFTHDAAHARIQVCDTGEGIEPEHIPQLFDRFYRTDKSRARDTGGAGLGLAITKAMVEAHGGTVAAHSDGRGRGSCFTLSLPLEDVINEGARLA